MKKKEESSRTMLVHITKFMTQVPNENFEAHCKSLYAPVARCQQMLITKNCIRHRVAKPCVPKPVFAVRCWECECKGAAKRKRERAEERKKLSTHSS